MKTLTPRNFGLCVTAVTPVKSGMLLSTPFTLSDGSIVTLLARTAKDGRIELSDWGMTADYLDRHGKKWDEVLERMALRHVVHGGVKVQGREILSVAEKKNVHHHIGAIVQTILTLNNSILLSPDAEDEGFTKKVDKAIRSELGKTFKIFPDWHDSGYDPHKAFTVDYRINGASPPVHIYVVGSLSKITRITATSLFFKSVKIYVPSIVIINPELPLGARQKERVQVAGDKLIRNIDRQARQLPELMKSLNSSNN